MVLADLHTHFYGSVPADAVLRQVVKRGDEVLWDWYETGFEAAYGHRPDTREIVRRWVSGDAEAVEAFRNVYVFGDADAGAFARFSGKGNLIWAAQEEDGLYGTVEGLGYAEVLLSQMQLEGVEYVEWRHHPSEKLLEWCAQQRDQTIRLAVTLDRDDPWADWEEVKRLVLGPYGSSLSGVDFCGMEEGHPPKTLAGFLAEVHHFNAEHPERALAILFHVGESFQDKSLESAVRWVHEAAELGAHRLGHAIALGVDPHVYGEHSRTESVAERIDQVQYDLRQLHGLREAGVEVDEIQWKQELNLLAGQSPESTITISYDDERLSDVRRRQDFAMARVNKVGAVIEVCPTSNRRIGGITNPAAHPVHRFLAAGLPVVVCTDDAGQFETTLAQELDWVVTHVQGPPELRERLLSTAWASRSEVLSGRSPRPT